MELTLISNQPSVCGTCWTNNGGPNKQLPGLKGSAADVSVPDTAEHPEVSWSPRFKQSAPF